jgi:archaeal flagellar protein FlaI
METSDTRKKTPLRSLSTDALLDVEGKVDEILNAHKEVRRRGQESSVHPNIIKPRIISTRPPSLFFVKSKNKTNPVKQVEKEKKPSPVKVKKHIGFGKKHKGIKPIDLKPRIESTLVKKQEVPPSIQEPVAQVKPDEAIWLDQKNKTGKTEEGDVKSEKNASQGIEEVVKSSDHNTKVLDQAKKQPGASKTEENTVRVDSNDAFFDDKAQKQDLFANSVFDSPSPSATSKKVKFDGITPDGQIQFTNEANSLKSITLKKMGYTETAIEEIDFYPLHEPFAYVEIIRENDSLDKRYVLVEVELSVEEMRLQKFIKETLTGVTFKTDDLEVKGEDVYLAEKVDQVIDEYMITIDAFTKKKIMYYLRKECLGLGKLEILMKDPNIEDISCDGSGIAIFLYHRRYGSLKSNVQFTDEDELTALVVKLAQKCGKHISIAEPMLDATMPDGSRIQMTLSTEVTTKGSTFTIRKFSEDPFSPPDLIEFNTMSSEMVAYMWLAVENGVNALIAGGTAAGKTSTLNAISLFIPRESKIVTIEETREINLPHPNWIPGVVRSGFGDVVGNKVIGEIDLYDLMKAALRQRPEYILVGEIRGKEAYVLFQAMATGHTTYSTVHADSAQSLIHRLEGKPIEIPRIMLQALDIVCIQVIARAKNKRVRRCKQIIEIIDIDPTTKEILTNEVFHWDPIEDKFMYSGKSYILERIRAEKDISREDMISEIKNRATLLEWMNKNNIREFKKVATVVAQYADNPTDVLKKIKE